MYCTKVNEAMYAQGWKDRLANRPKLLPFIVSSFTKVRKAKKYNERNHAYSEGYNAAGRYLETQGTRVHRPTPGRPHALVKHHIHMKGWK